MKRLAATVLAGVLAATALGAAPAGAEEAPVKEEWRSYWVDSFNPGIYNEAEVAKLVEDAKDVGANALIVQVSRYFDCLCNKSTYPRTQAGIAPAPYDPLEAIVEAAHAEGIEVHAWVNINSMWNGKALPVDPNHILNTHGFDAEGADRWLNKRSDGEERIGNRVFADPANPAVVEYIVDGVRSIQENYDVDGINLDFVRYPDHNVNEEEIFSNDWGYSETSLARFHADTGRTDVPDPKDEQFSDWRRDQISNVVRKLYVSMYETDASDRLSINGINYSYGPSHYGSWEQTRPYLNVMQDWYGWALEGSIDTITAMNYKREWQENHEVMFETWNQFIAQTQAESGRHMVSGPGLYMNDIDNSVKQAKEVIGFGLGWSGYSYNDTSITAIESDDQAVKNAERAKLAARLCEEVFTGEAKVPEMTWKTHPTDGIVHGVMTIDGKPADQVEFTISGKGETRTVKTDGSGWFAALKLKPGRYKVKIADPSQVKGARPQHVRVTAGGLTEVNQDFRGK